MVRLFSLAYYTVNFGTNKAKFVAVWFCNFVALGITHHFQKIGRMLTNYALCGLKLVD